MHTIVFTKDLKISGGPVPMPQKKVGTHSAVGILIEYNKAPFGEEISDVIIFG